MHKVFIKLPAEGRGWVSRGKFFNTRAFEFFHPGRMLRVISGFDEEDNGKVHPTWHVTASSIDDKGNNHPCDDAALAVVRADFGIEDATEHKQGDCAECATAPPFRSRHLFLDIKERLTS